jgi:Flp pilus assembly protein TadB
MVHSNSSSRRKAANQQLQQHTGSLPGLTISIAWPLLLPLLLLLLPVDLLLLLLLLLVVAAVVV